MAVTTNYSWGRPDVGADENTWGTELNTTLQDIDTDLKATDDAVAATVVVANAALPKAGGVMTGRVENHSGTIRFVDLGTGSGTQTLNLANGNWFRLRINGTTTIALSNVPNVANHASAILLQLDRATELPTWPASFEWPAATAPVTFSTAGVDTYAAFTIDAGVTWLVSKIQSDVR